MFDNLLILILVIIIGFILLKLIINISSNRDKLNGGWKTSYYGVREEIDWDDLDDDVLTDEFMNYNYLDYDDNEHFKDVPDAFGAEIIDKLSKTIDFMRDSGNHDSEINEISTWFQSNNIYDLYTNYLNIITNDKLGQYITIAEVMTFLYRHDYTLITRLEEISSGAFNIVYNIYCKYIEPPFKEEEELFRWVLRIFKIHSNNVDSLSDHNENIRESTNIFKTTIRAFKDCQYFPYIFDGSYRFVHNNNAEIETYWLLVKRCEKINSYVLFNDLDEKMKYINALITIRNIAHENDLVYGDWKIDNVMYDPHDKTYVLTDMEFARPRNGIVHTHNIENIEMKYMKENAPDNEAERCMMLDDTILMKEIYSIYKNTDENDYRRDMRKIVIINTLLEFAQNILKEQTESSIYTDFLEEFITNVGTFYALTDEEKPEKVLKMEAEIKTELLREDIGDVRNNRDRFKKMPQTYYK